MLFLSKDGIPIFCAIMLKNLISPVIDKGEIMSYICCINANNCIK